MFYAVDLGSFKRAGLDIDMTIMNNPGPIVAAVAGGTTAIAGMPVSLAAVARDKGLPLVMFAPLSLYITAAPDHDMIVMEDSPLRKASDLNGKTIATRDFGNMSYFGAKAWADKNGGDSKSTRWVESNDTLDIAALQAGRIDAASISEPALDCALQGGQVRMMAKVFDAIAPRFLIAGCVTSESYAKAHPDVIRKYADVIASTAKWANANQMKSGEFWLNMRRHRFSPARRAHFTPNVWLPPKCSRSSTCCTRRRKSNRR